MTTAADKPSGPRTWWLRASVLPEYVGKHTFKDGSTSRIVMMAQVDDTPTHCCSLTPSWYFMTVGYDTERRPADSEEDVDIPVDLDDHGYIDSRPPPAAETPPGTWLRHDGAWWFLIDASKFDEDDWGEVNDGNWANTGLSGGWVQWPGEIFAEDATDV